MAYIHVAFNVSPPDSINMLYGTWLNGTESSTAGHIRMGVCALLWAIWNIRNDYIFNNAKLHSFMQVISLATHWIRMWSYLQPMDKRAALDFGCSRLLLVAQELYIRCSWRFDLRISC